MARTTQELLERLLAFLPPQYQTSEPLLAGVADALQAAEGAADELLQVLPFGPYLAILPGGAPLSLVGASGIWLDLHASGYGLLRAPGETDDQLRTRLRNVEDAVTRPAILAAVNTLLEPFSVAAMMVEWWEEPYLDVLEPIPGGLYLDSAFLSGGPNTFILIVPQVGLGYGVSQDPHLDIETWLDSMFLGDDRQDPVYAAIVAEVERLRAAGVRWRLYIGDTPP